ncbi:MAG: glycosyltransferase involved in cell wall biosynthesis, partial [Limisphaerales bacterium]
MNNKHAFFLMYDGLTDPLARSQVIPYLIGLTKQGYRFTIHSCDKPDRMERFEARIREVLAPWPINWVSVPYTKSPPILSTAKDLKNLKKAAFKTAKKDPPFAVHCRSYLAGMVGNAIKKEFGAKLLFDIRGFWIDENIEGGNWNMSSLPFKTAVKYLRKQEKNLFRQADHVVSLTENGKETIQSWDWLQGQVPEISVIPTCVDLAHFDPSKLSDSAKEKTRAAFNLHVDAKVICYLGSIGTWYLLDEMLDCYIEYRKQLNDPKFLFITPDDPSHIIKQAAAKGIPQDELRITEATREQVPEFLAVADYSIFFIMPVYSKRASSPTKMGEIMSMGIPLICNAGVGDVDHIMEKTGCGALVQSMTSRGYQDAIKQLISGNFAASDLRNEAKKWYSLESGINNYHRIYKMLEGHSDSDALMELKQESSS